MDTINSQQNYEDLLGGMNEKKETLSLQSTIRKPGNRGNALNHKRGARNTRPITITMSNDVKESITILAAQERVRPWIVVDRALREYLEKRNSIKQ